MVREVTRHACEHCDETFATPGGAEIHEREHQIHDLIQQIADVHDHKHTVQSEVVLFLEDWLEYGEYTSGLTSCQSCGAEAHEKLGQCPECHRPVQEIQTSAVLRCGGCGSDTIRVMQKEGQRDGYGYRCCECHSFVAHGNGTFSFWSNADDDRELGRWSDA